MGYHRSALRRLEEDDVAGYQGRRDHPGGNREREIPRGNHDDQTAWEEHEMVQLSRFTSQSARPTEATHLLGVKFQKVDRLSDISVRFAPGFSRLKNLPCRQFKAPAAHDR